MERFKGFCKFAYGDRRFRPELACSYMNEPTYVAVFSKRENNVPEIRIL